MNARFAKPSSVAYGANAAARGWLARWWILVEKHGFGGKFFEAQIDRSHLCPSAVHHTGGNRYRLPRVQRQ